ncbi:hypothetical protein NLI92_002870 [Priestia megaterium]|uniref:hypothetical protein n=1 Tax=Priestia megaterium TaxID=1404 RepID=UPI0021AC1D72|nr:hypothetical protein [Priestia megaterium]MCR8927481.1 hypothetical protein [Priestia megaterium]
MKYTKSFFLPIFIMIYFQLQTHAYAENDISQKSRVSLKIKDTKGVDYNVFFFTSKEKKTDYYLCSTGDEVYIGDYSFAIQKQGKKEIKMTSIKLKGYPYNQTQQTVFPIQTKSNLYPDIVLVSEQVDCNTKLGHLYYVHNGKMIPIKHTIAYILPPRFNEKNQLETMNYNNVAELPWELSTYTLDLKSNSLKFIGKKSFSNDKAEKIKDSW